MKFLAAAALAACALAGVARAEDSLDQPKIAEGDVWVYDDVEKKNGAVKEADLEIAVERLQDDKMLASIKNPGAQRPPIEVLMPLDWRRERSINGVVTVVNRPLSFPLAVGKTWRTTYTEDNPVAGRAREQIDVTSKVIGWTDVKTPAGVFKALKIEANGTWTADLAQRVVNSAVIARPAPNVAAASTAQNVTAAKKVTGQIHREFYYAPSIKRWVKSIEDFYDINGRLTSSSEMQLRAFHAGG